MLTLGNVTFNVDDLPEEINLGGEQVLAVRQFPGGGLDVQALGAFDDVIQWDGTFLFDTALSNCKAIDAIRQQGEPVQLQAGPFTRQVLVQKFTFKYQNDYYIPYSIELQPLTSYASSVTVNGLPNTTPVAISLSDTTSGAPATGTVQAAPATPPQPQKIHIVRRGETLWKIAIIYKRPGTSWPLIANANGIKNPGILQIGTRLVIPW